MVLSSLIFSFFNGYVSALGTKKEDVADILFFFSEIENLCTFADGFR